VLGCHDYVLRRWQRRKFLLLNARKQGRHILYSTEKEAQGGLVSCSGIQMNIFLEEGYLFMRDQFARSRYSLYCPTWSREPSQTLQLPSSFLCSSKKQRQHSPTCAREACPCCTIARCQGVPLCFPCCLEELRQRTFVYPRRACQARNVARDAGDAATCPSKVAL
jgi:hypothetical protein